MFERGLQGAHAQRSVGAGGQRQAVGGRNTDGGRPAHLHSADGGAHRLGVRAAHYLDGEGQAGLINQTDHVVLPPDGAGRSSLRFNQA